MTNKLSAKNKTMIFVAILLIAFTALLMWAAYLNQMSKLHAMENDYYLNIKTSYEKIVEKHKQYYINKSKLCISSDVLRKAVENKDRKEIIKIATTQWNTLVSENKYLKLMHFHSPGGISLVRMHKQKMFGDVLIDTRPMIKRINNEHEQLHGFESGPYHIAYRIITPIFENDKYIGALEFGSRPDLFLSEMKYYNNLEGALFIKDNNLNLYKEKVDFSIGDYVLQYLNLEDPDVFNFLKEDGYAFQNFYHTHYKGNAINVYSFDIKDFKGNVVAKTVLINDISEIEKDFVANIKKMGIFLFVLLCLLLLVINIGFKKIISSLDDTNKELKKNKKFLQLILDNTAHGVIATKPDGTITLFNKKAEAMLGYAESELVGKMTPLKFHKQEEVILKAKELSSKYGEKIEPDFEVLIAKSLHGEENSNEWCYVSRDGYEFPVNVYMTTIENGNGIVTGYVGIAEDISIKKVMERKLNKQKDELEAVFNTSRDGIAIMDLQTNFLFLNKSYEKMTGYSKEELLTKSCLELTVDEDKEISRIAVEEMMVTGLMENFEKRCIRKDGSTLNVSMTFVLMPDKKRFLSTSKDITNSKKTEKQIKDYMELIDTHTIASTTDIHGNYIYVSSGFSSISGYSKDELIGMNHRKLRHPNVDENAINAVYETIKNGQLWRGEIRNVKKDSAIYWTYSYISGMHDEKGKLVGYTSISHDITDKKLIEQLSITDGLTGIHNRRHFNDIFPKYVNSAKRHKEYINFIIMDIDNFKQYNDNYGHQMGDQALIKIANTLKSAVQRADDFCFRLGGEEFGVLYKTKDEKSAIEIAEKIRCSIQDLAIPHKETVTGDVITVSIGLICSLAEDIENTNALYAEADKLLYKAKANGRNRIEYSTPSD